ncbi:membrane-associated protein, putative [Bodo saltans]|uniref:Membrane-associated protein, putative n=1 Tax=Bodo saltans TaxID=75058 RepID=A0A0S4JCW9_BODSA|nr:membrane-associated protein, putative [Bodo saltans]|eukprot:CUG88248.1 membrane-associated protein, putative [Bodo saltans]
MEPSEVTVALEKREKAAAAASISSRLRFYIVDLQILSPIILFCFAAATLGFIIGDAVEEQSALESQRRVDGVFYTADATMQISLFNAQSPTTIYVKALPIINGLKALKVFDPYRGMLDQVGSYLSLSNPNAAIQKLGDIQLALLADVIVRVDKLDTRGGSLMAFLLNIHLSHETAAGLMQMSEGETTTKRGLKAIGTNIMCSPLIQQWVSRYFPTASSTVYCDNTAQSIVSTASDVDITLNPSDYSDILIELADTMEGYRLILEGIRSDLYTSWVEERGYTKRIAVLSIAFVISVAGTISTALLVLSQYRSLHEQSVVESDFDCNAQRVKIRPKTLRAVDEISSRVGVMGDLTDVFLHPSDLNHIHTIVPAAVGNQIELHLRRAVEPLQLLRPFVPKFMYLHNLRSQSVMGRSASALLRNSEMLNLAVGIKKKSVSLLFVGLRSFNEESSDLELLNELLSAVHLACSHFQGHVVQMSSAGIVATFSRATLNEDRDGVERVEDGEVLAVHAAMAVYGICSAPMERPDGSIRGPFPVSMCVSHSIAFAGVASFHVSKQFALLAPAIAHAVAVEPLNDLHGTSILTTSATNDLIGDHFITRPVHYVTGVGSAYHVIVARPEEGDDGYEQLIKDQAKVREKAANWSKVWEKYEALVSTDKPTYEMLEDAHRDLEGYKVFQMEASEEDIAFQLAVTNVKRIAQHLGVNLGSTVEEE